MATSDPDRQWSFGDKLVHAERPEWGVGVVTGAAKQVADGRPCQRLTIRFDRAGIKTLSTAHAKLRAPEDTPAMVAAQTGQAGTWLERLETTSPEEIMLAIPDEATDPFTPLADRIGATLTLYRFDDSSGSLLDWASIQSGLADPLAAFNRHELEQLFGRFTVALDNHLRALTEEARRKIPGELPGLLASAPARARNALRRIDARR